MDILKGKNLIPLKNKGQSINIDNFLVGKITRNIYSCNSNSILIYEKELNQNSDFSCLAILTSSDSVPKDFRIPIVFKVYSLEHYDEGDLVLISSEGVISTLYRVNSSHNSLFVTEQCNSNCLMCSQPPKDRSDEKHFFDINTQLISLIPKECSILGITGGEPTIIGEYFYKLIEIMKLELPNTELHILTNGRHFAKLEQAQKLADIEHNNLMLGVPIYSDYYVYHDYIVQAKNAFYQTIIGLHNLARVKINIEIRIVLHKLTIPRLVKLSHFIYKNLPFVKHITFMGLENTGYTPHNLKLLWIDPTEIWNDLKESVLYLEQMNMNVSIYNMQLCNLPYELWKFARKSISDWKNEYLPICNDCSVKEECAGFFVFNKDLPYKNIKPVGELEIN